MNRKRILKIARKAMDARITHPGREAGYIFNHGQRVAQLALSLSKTVPLRNPIDSDMLYAAALFHDVGKGVEPHAQTGAVVVRDLLGEVCSRAELSTIARLVGEHNARGRGKCLVGSRILQDADALDHTGGQMGWLLAGFSIQVGQGTAAMVAYYRGREHRRYLKKLRDQMNFDHSREEFDCRMRLSDRFCEMLEEEEAGILRYSESDF